MSSTTEQNTKYTGQVKFFNKDRGYGFIKRLSDSKEFFVHHSAICPSTRCWNVLYKGEYVEFSLVEGNKGTQSDKVTGLEGGSLLCDHEFEYRRRRAQKRKANREQENNVEGVVVPENNV